MFVGTEILALSCLHLAASPASVGRHHAASIEHPEAAHDCMDHQISADHSLVLDASRIYGLTPAFVLSYIDHQKFPEIGQFESWAEFRKTLAPLSQMYVDFAMTCVQRARAAAAHIGLALEGAEDAEQVAAGKRYLDVGCGYGGFVREFAQRGYEAVGVELQRHLAEFSRANCVDLPNARIVEGDLLKLDAGGIGTFDLISCNDVIEHVQDATVAIEVLARMVRPGGELFLEIPNKDCIDSVRSDGHFQQFGVTLLERHASAALVESMSGTTNYLVEMGEMYGLQFYLSALESAGLDVEAKQVHVIGSLADVPSLLAALTQAHSQWDRAAKERLNPHLYRHVSSRFADYMRICWANYGRALAGQGAHEFQSRYLNSFWTVLARRRT